MISVVIFDLGNVILPVEGQRLARNLAPYSSLDPDSILRTFGNELINNNFESGKMDPWHFYQHINQICQLKNVDFEQFKGFFNDIFVENPQVVDLIKKLKPRYKLGMISNTNSIHSLHLLEKYALFKDFDRVWLSHEAGIRKPDPSIYQMALSHFSVAPGETVFIDDLPKNVQGAQKVGMKAIQFKNYDQLTQELEKMGVSV